MKAQFQFYEIVRVAAHYEGVDVVGLEGAILGMSDDERGDWGYAVHLFTLRETWDFPESDLESTGKIGRREDFYDGSAIKVFVHPDTLEGDISPTQ